MAQHNFEGAVDNISDRQLEYIQSVIVEQGFENSKVTFELVGKPGDNYVASVKRIIIEGENGSLRMIAKIAPGHELLRQAANTNLFFRNEHVMYTEVLPKLVQLQKEAGIPAEEQFKYAKCFGSLSEEPNEVILLEDLKTSDFIMLDRFEILSSDCIKSVLKNLALLHSLSYVCRQRDPEAYESFKANLVDMWAAMDGSGPGVDQMKFFFQCIENDVISILDDPEHVNAVKHKVAGALSLAAKLAKADNESKYNVVVQGDAWTNNLLFKFEDGEIPASIMVDYQLSKNCSPVYDIIYMIFNGTDHESRKKNFNDWIDYYHSELDKSLSNFDLKVNFIYPRDRLDADLKRYGKVMFGLCLCLVSVLVRKSDDAAKVMEAMQDEDMTTKVQEMGVSNSDDETKTRYRNKVIGLIDSFNEFGLFSNRNRDNMARYNFEGDIDKISERQLEFINDVIIEQGFKNSKVVFEPLGKAGDNYVANVKRITVQGDNGSLTMIAKIAPCKELFLEASNATESFKNEHVMYTEILPKFLQIQKDAGVPEEKLFRHAKCYGSLSEDSNEIILLEDLTLSNFAMLDRFEPLSKECIKSVLKNLAVFHSLSYACREKEPGIFEKYKSKLIDTRSVVEGPGAEQIQFVLQCVENDILNILDNPEHVELVRGKVVGAIKDAAVLTNADIKNKYNVIAQGDAWSNNIMFKLENGKEPASILLDYQLAKNSCPVFDLIYMIFNGTNHETRKENYPEWIDYYHSELGKSLSNFDLDVDSIYPRDVLDADLKRYGKVMFGACVALVNILVRKSDDVANAMEALHGDDLDEQAKQLSVMQSDNETRILYKNKIVELIDSFTMFEML
ncbi:uncharacterized protein LOC142980764 [Anticarsia gemmatalis]|uniref:uncharacterized protein LOC142980764 n=1 Tax=Anticarsia gemmatalis TaxID=129554 RepID=UPI003F7596BA